jgi:hypothetical protein
MIAGNQLNLLFEKWGWSRVGASGKEGDLIADGEEEERDDRPERGSEGEKKVNGDVNREKTGGGRQAGF